jgi:hypothetical protein
MADLRDEFFKDYEGSPQFAEFEFDQWLKGLTSQELEEITGEG